MASETNTSAIELINETIADLEAKLGLQPGASILLVRQRAADQKESNNNKKAENANKQEEQQQSQPKR